MTDAPGITVSGMAKIGGHTLFAPLTLTIPSCEWTVLLGSSGVGKTTILRLIAGLETGADFDGEITAQDGAPIAPRIAYMAQQDLLLPWATVIENITLAPRLRRETPDPARLAYVLKSVGLIEHADRKPAELSGGQRQRAALARTLLEDKPIVLLDEPFSALDARTRADMQELACDLLTQKTVLLVTHDPAEAARLGRNIQVLSETGLTNIPAPDGMLTRGIDDPATLATQARLLTILRGQAA